MDFNINTIFQQLSPQVERAGQDIRARLTGASLNDPGQMLEAQFAIQQYSVLVAYQSTLMKTFKDMLHGIIQKI